MKRTVFILAIVSSALQAGVFKPSTNHVRIPMGWGKWCLSLVSSLVPFSGNYSALSAFPEGSIPFLETEKDAKPADRSNLLVYADWRQEMYGEGDSFMHYLRASDAAMVHPEAQVRAEKADEANRLVRKFGKAWFSDWSRYFGKARFSPQLTGAWVTRIEFSNVRDWEALADGLQEFISFYPFVEHFHFVLESNIGFERVRTLSAQELQTCLNLRIGLSIANQQPQQNFFQVLVQQSEIIGVVPSDLWP